MSATPVFHNLWPTTIMSVTLPGSDMANPVLSEFINELDDERSNLTTEYLNQEFLEIDHPVVKWLSDCFKRATVDYATNGGIDYEIDFHVQGWPNINRFGDYHNLHNHPHSWLSGTYYVSVPIDDPSIGSRNDLNPNDISFFDPRPQSQVLLPQKKEDNIDNGNLVSFPSAAGHGYIFPSWLVHWVPVQQDDELRISIAWNIVLRGEYGAEKDYQYARI